MALRRFCAAGATTVALTIALLAVLPHAGAPVARSHPAPRSAGAPVASSAPLAFAKSGDAYLARGSHYALAVDARGSSLTLLAGRDRRPTTVRTNLIAAKPSPPEATRRLPGIINRFEGPRSRWRAG